MAFKGPHVNARANPYPTSDGTLVERVSVADDEVAWDISDDVDHYKPPHYTDKVVLAKPVWADDEDKLDEIVFNRADGKINRLHYNTKGEQVTYRVDYKVDDADANSKVMPRNPEGRTGLCGRGLLGKFGPNHAADPVVTSFELEDDKTDKLVVDEEGWPVVYVLLVQRGDGGGWAFPGGMVNDGESVGTTLKREFGEEAMNRPEDSEPGPFKFSDPLAEDLFKQDMLIYRGYVDDPRNTDNAWMVTTAKHFHDPDGSFRKNVKLKAGSDATGVMWKQIQLNNLPDLFASHRFILLMAFEKLMAELKCRW